MKRSGSKWPMFLLALAGVVLAAVFVIVSREGVPLESNGVLHSKPIVAVKLVFVVCIIFLGLFENWVTKEKRNR